ncbi:glycoside hydrolase family 32 protein [Acidobacteria bacterium AB60]|nr:glycoside hydrolase family 32 protein [Acidobacteria bacterium AB60]
MCYSPGVNRRRFLKTLGGGAAAVALSRALRAEVEAIAKDPLRPSYHLLPPHNWMNDPNGPIFWKGQYHLFYQLNPGDSVWGDMHWGHAVSPDMIHWRHQPIALAPTPGGPDSEGCFSGSAVVYHGTPAFIYTGVQNAPLDQVTLHDGNDKLRETQMLAMAEDDALLHWKKLEQPVIPAPPPGMKVTGFRDPCPWRDGPWWYCGIGSGERGVGGCVLLYRSRGLRTWEYLHKLAEGKPNGKQTANPCDSGEMWECPDFFTVDKRTCLFYSTEGKVIWSTGDYDRSGMRFAPRRDGVLDHGAYYAPKSFEAADSRRILWGWIRETRPDAELKAAGWAGCMSLPRVLTIGAQGQLEMNPAKEVESLRGAREEVVVSRAAPFRRKLSELAIELQVPGDISNAATTTVRLLVDGRPAWELAIDTSAKEVRCGDVTFPLPGMPWAHPTLRLFLDGSVIESFVGGREALTSRVYTLTPGATELEVVTTGGKEIRVEMWGMKAISADRMTAAFSF